MKRLRVLAATFTSFLLIAGSFGVSVPAGASAAVPNGSASVSASSGGKKKCQKFKGKKKRQCLKNAGKGSEGNGGKKPWAGSPYKPKMTCAMSPEMQKKYARYGLTCIDLGFGVTTLVEL